MPPRALNWVPLGVHGQFVAYRFKEVEPYTIAEMQKGNTDVSDLGGGPGSALSLVRNSIRLLIPYPSVFGKQFTRFRG